MPPPRVTQPHTQLGRLSRLVTGLRGKGLSQVFFIRRLFPSPASLLGP